MFVPQDRAGGKVKSINKGLAHNRAALWIRQNFAYGINNPHEGAEELCCTVSRNRFQGDAVPCKPLSLDKNRADLNMFQLMWICEYFLHEKYNWNIHALTLCPFIFSCYSDINLSHHKIAFDINAEQKKNEWERRAVSTAAEALSSHI